MTFEGFKTSRVALPEKGRKKGRAEKGGGFKL
jgi:hypothetical protein